MKTILKTFIPGLLLISLCLQVSAATLVETEEGDAGVQRMWILGSKMRVDMGDSGEYMLVDYSSKMIVIIDPAKKEIMDVSDFASGDPASIQGLNVRVKHLGPGPSIAGYATQKYALSVNGQTCSQTLLSRKALKDANLANLMEAMTRIEFNPMGSQFMSECDRADVLFAKKMKKLGMPLATVEQNGVVTDKVKRIVKNASLPAGGFNLPSGYKKVSMQQKMQEAMGMMPGAAGGAANPDMQKMMQDLMRQQGQ